MCSHNPLRWMSTRAEYSMPLYRNPDIAAYVSLILAWFFAMGASVYGATLQPLRIACVSGLEHQEPHAGKFQGKLQLEIRKNAGWNEWDAKFSDVVLNETKQLNTKRTHSSNVLHFLLTPSSSAKHRWGHIVVGLGICTVDKKKACKAGTFRFPITQDPTGAAKSVMSEMFGSGGRLPPCKEEWFDMN